jgi:hypothetical protein
MSGSASTWPGVQESELESEFEQELEAETEGEAFLGGLGNVLGGLLGEGETTAESEFEGEFESEGEFEGEAFSFGSLWKKLKPLAKKLAPMVGTAILGPAGSALGSLAASALGEGEFEGEFEGEGEFESEFEGEGEFEGEFEAEGEAEAAHEISARPLTESEALAEMMADAAARAASESESEAMVGAAVVTVLSPRDRRALGALLPDLIRGVTVLTRVLRRRRMRRAIAAMPTVVRRSVRDMKRHAASGRKVTRRTAAKATARQVRRVLGSPKVLGSSLARNARATRAMKRAGGRHRAVRG